MKQRLDITSRQMMALRLRLRDPEVVMAAMMIVALLLVLVLIWLIR